MSRFKVAGVQMDIEFAEVDRNLQKMESRLEETVANGAALTVFPECTTTGYCFESIGEAKQLGESIDGPSVTRVGEWCVAKDTMVIFGFLELENDCLYNSLALLGPSGVIGSYRKIHLPFLGVDRFTTPGGRPPKVFQASGIRLGMNICYDSSFPESARILAIEGADLIALPTNWPPTSGLTADLIPNARALENHVYFMSVNRVGVERGFEFIGKSKICDPRGANLAFENHAEETILYAEIDSGLARKKHLVSIPGAHEVHRINDRRPDLYRSLTDPLKDVGD